MNDAFFQNEQLLPIGYISKEKILKSVKKLNTLKFELNQFQIRLLARQVIRQDNIYLLIHIKGNKKEEEANFIRYKIPLKTEGIYLYPNSIHEKIKFKV
jgi:hypothetical protein